MDLSPVYGMLNDSLMASKLSNSAQVISNLSMNPRPAQDVNWRCNFSQQNEEVALNLLRYEQTVFACDPRDTVSPLVVKHKMSREIHSPSY